MNYNLQAAIIAAAAPVFRNLIYCIYRRQI